MALTIFLGPGVGHLYLRKFAKALILIGATFAAVLHLAWRASRTFPVAATLSTNSAVQYMQEFTRNNSKIMFYYDVIFAAIWAYALVDAFMVAKKSYQPKEQDPDDDSRDENR